MNINKFKVLFTQQLFLFVENSVKQPISVLSSLVASFIQEKYRNYKEQKRINQLTQYRTLVLSQIAFFQKELEEIDRYRAGLQTDEFADFFFEARKRISEQQLKIDFLSTICFDEFEIDSETYTQMKLIEQYQKCSSIKNLNVVAIGSDYLKNSLQKQRYYIEYLKYMSTILKSCLTHSIYKQQGEDYSKYFLLILKSESQILKEEKRKIKYNLFCTNLSRFIYYQRKAFDWTQEELSNESGVNRSSIAKIETLKQIPTIETLFCLLTSLNADILLVASETTKEGD